jgi:transient receptor potential cation channel subfamily C
MAIDNENLEILEFLLSQKEVQTKDALLHAISEQYVEAVELLLDWEDKIHEEGQPHVSQEFNPCFVLYMT